MAHLPRLSVVDAQAYKKVGVNKMPRPAARRNPIETDKARIVRVRPGRICLSLAALMMASKSLALCTIRHLASKPTIVTEWRIWRPFHAP
jgi:hypothetical protein